MYLEVIAVLHYNNYDGDIHACVLKACISSSSIGNALAPSSVNSILPQCIYPCLFSCIHVFLFTAMHV